METCREPSKCYRIMNDLEEIIEHVLNLLPMKELHKCARVCTRWNAVSKRVKKSRRAFSWLMNDTGGTVGVERDVKGQLELIPSEPKFALLFCSSMMFETPLAVPSSCATCTSRNSRSAKMERMSITDYIQKLLPPSCPLIGTITDGIVGTGSSSTVPSEVESTSALSCLLLPDIEGLTISHFMMTPDNQHSLEPLVTDMDSIDADPNLVGGILGIPSGKQPKFVLLFEIESAMTVSRSVDIDYVLLRCYENVVIAGGYVDNIYPEELADTQPVGECNCMGVAFTGDNIKVASVVVSQDVRSKSGVEKCLEKLKNCHIPPVNQIGFMFACIGRGEHFHRATNLESGVFHAMFPKVPLFGFFGNGEIGYDYLPDYSKPEGDSNMSLLGEYSDESGFMFDIPQINHSYTTIFVLLSLGESQTS